MHLRATILYTFVLFFFSCKEVPTDHPTKSDNLMNRELLPIVPLYEDLNGHPVSLSDFKGKRVLLNYWATWCRPCIEEMPALVELQQRLVNENYVFLFASDQDIKEIIEFKEVKGFDFTYLKYNGNYAEQEISALPVTLIFNEIGEQVARFNGGMAWGSPEMLDRLKDIQ